MRFQHVHEDVIHAENNGRANEEPGDHGNQHFPVPENQQEQPCQQGDGNQQDGFFHQQGKDEERDGCKAQQEKVARQAFPVKDDTEGKKHQGHAGFIFRQDQQHGQEDDAEAGQFGTYVREPDAQRTQVFGQGHIGGKLREFGRLNAKLPDPEPGFASGYIVAQEEYGHEAQYAQAIK